MDRSLLAPLIRRFRRCSGPCGSCAVPLDLGLRASRDMVWGIRLCAGATHSLQQDVRVGLRDIVQLTNAQIHPKQGAPVDTHDSQFQPRGTSTLYVRNRLADPSDSFALGEFTPGKVEGRTFYIDLAKNDLLFAIGVRGCNFDIHVTGNVCGGVIPASEDLMEQGVREGEAASRAAWEGEARQMDQEVARLQPGVPRGSRIG